MSGMNSGEDPDIFYPAQLKPNPAKKYRIRQAKNQRILTTGYENIKFLQ